jgi:hypothetical protein
MLQHFKSLLPAQLHSFLLPTISLHYYTVSLTNKSITLNTAFQDAVSHLPSLVHSSGGKPCSYSFHGRKGTPVPHPPLTEVGTCIDTNISITSNTSKCWPQYLQMLPYCHKITHVHTRFWYIQSNSACGHTWGSISHSVCHSSDIDDTFCNYLPSPLCLAAAPNQYRHTSINYSTNIQYCYSEH